MSLFCIGSIFWCCFVVPLFRGCLPVPLFHGIQIVPPVFCCSASVPVVHQCSASVPSVFRSSPGVPCSVIPCSGVPDFIVLLSDVERRKKTEDGENVFFKALATNLLLTSKSCLWPTFYQMNFMKR